LLPALKNIENTTNSINKKIARLEVISAKKRKLLNELMKIDVSSLNKKIADFFSKKLQEEILKQKQIENAIKRSKEIMKKTEEITKKIRKNIPKKQINNAKKEVEKHIKTPVKEIEEIMPKMWWFGF